MNQITILEDEIGWGDRQFQKRKNIANKIALFLSLTYGNDFLKKEAIVIRPLSTHKQTFACNNIDNPCVCPGRHNICISSKGQYWCQFVYQLSHEFCHCITARLSLPQGVKWFDEFLACFTSLLVMDYLSKDDMGIRKLYPTGFANVMREYLDTNYLCSMDNDLDNTQNLFAQNHQSYIADENYVKEHKEYALKLFYHVRSNRKGLTFIGKIRNYENVLCKNITVLLDLLRNECNQTEIEVIDYIADDIFGLRKKEIA